MLSHEKWHDFLPYTSFDVCRDFLIEKYTGMGVPDPKEQSYRNCMRFSYLLTHGEAHFKEAEHVQLSLQPLLLFYGLTHFLKATLLIVDPQYPETSKMLAHGLSSRKKKKQHFHYLNDSVKVQREGLFSSVSIQMFHMEPLQGKVWVIKDLITLLPSLQPIMVSLYGQEKKSTESLPELLSYYALLYHLSMISRYETEWWYEEGVNGTTRERVLLINVLQNSLHHIPSLITNYLQ